VQQYACIGWPKGIEYLFVGAQSSAAYAAPQAANTPLHAAITKRVIRAIIASLQIIYELHAALSQILTSSHQNQRASPCQKTKFSSIIRFVGHKLNRNELLIAGLEQWSRTMLRPCSHDRLSGNPRSAAITYTANNRLRRSLAPHGIPQR
jgi:hypothetical protein